MEKLTKGVTNILSFILIVLMAVMVLDVTWQVITRFILKNPSSFTEELAGFLLIWIGLLGASYALHTRAHLGIDVLTFKLTGVKKQAVEILIYTIVLLFAFFYSALRSIFLFIRQALMAAEKPLSILTTVTPEAQLLSIVRRAESPSKLAP